MDSQMLALYAQRHNTYRFYAYQNAAQSVGNGTTVSLDTILRDPNNNFNTTTHAYTAPVDGYYLIIASLRVAADTANTFFSCQLSFTDFITGTTYQPFGEGVPTSIAANSTNTCVKMAYVATLRKDTTLTLLSNVGVANNTLPGQTNVYMSGFCLSIR